MTPGILSDTASKAIFLTVFIWRYTRLAVNIISYNFLYKPSPRRVNPRYTPGDCSVIVPTIDPGNPRFRDCIRSVLSNNPDTVHVVTAGLGRHGHERLNGIKKVTGELQRELSSRARVVVSLIEHPNKRHQVAHAMRKIHTEITVLLDDSVTWGSEFLPSMLAAFEDPDTAFVGTKKRVVRVEDSKTGLARFWSMGWQFLGSIYLERHNFEVRATNAMDGSVFVISGRTSAIRTEIVNTSDFLTYFENERFFFGLLGPLNPDDDNAITRYVLKSRRFPRWKIKWQATEEATIDTVLGVDPERFIKQNLRWTRTTWRSNSCSVFTDRTAWRFPYGLFAIYLHSFVQFSLFADATMLFTVTQTSQYQTSRFPGLLLGCLAGFILLGKIAKLVPYLKRNPADVRFLPFFYFPFAYLHSFLRLWALLTFWDCEWSGRDLKAIDHESDGADEAQHRDGELAIPMDRLVERHPDGLQVASG